MKIAVVGTGYVGLVTGTCFADSGNEVTCVDIDEAKIDALNRGEIPIYEPGLAELVEHNVEAERLHFTTDLAAARQAGRARLPGRRHAAGRRRRGRPVGLVERGRDDRPAPAARRGRGHQEHRAGRHQRRDLRSVLQELTGRDCDVASNPEFLKEGAAIDDFMKPDRVVVGVRRPEVADVLRELYAPFLRTEKPFLVDVARERRDDQVRRQRAAGDEDQLHQRDGQPVRADGRPTSTTSAAASATTAASASRSCSPASATAAVAFPRTCGRSRRWPVQHGVEPRDAATPSTR